MIEPTDPEGPANTRARTRIVCTCVHGTFSSDRLWSGAAASLVDRLKSRFGDDLQFRVFSWNGWNGQKSRMKAAARLREELWQAILADPDARHVVLAHSHGGNVALYALKDAVLRSQVAGVATLATPFLAPQARSLDWLVQLAGISVGFQVFYWFLYAALRVLTGTILGFNDTWWVIRLVPAFWLLRFGAYLGLYVGDRLIWYGRRWVRRQQRRALRCYPRAVYRGLHVLNVQAPLDEARLLLRFFNGIANVPLRLMYHPIAVAMSFTWSAVALALWVYPLTKQAESVAWWRWLLGVLWLVNWSAFLVVLQCALFAPVLSILQTLIRGHIAGFGLERFAINAVVVVSSDDAPTIRGATVANPRYKSRDWRQSVRWFDLRHSWVYKASEPVDAVEQFLRGLPEETPARPAAVPLDQTRPRRDCRRDFRPTWIEDSLAALAVIGVIFILTVPTPIDADWRLPGTVGGDNAFGLSAPFAPRALLASRGALVAVQFSDLTEWAQQEDKLPLWKRAMSSEHPLLPFVYMRVVRLPGETRDRSAALDQSNDAATSTGSPSEELHAICRQFVQAVAETHDPIPGNSVQVTYVGENGRACSAIVPIDVLSGRIFGVFSGWRFWTVRRVPGAF